MKALTEEAICLLQKLIAIPSFSKTENKTADVIEIFFQQKGIPTNRLYNNVWTKNKFPLILAAEFLFRFFRKFLLPQLLCRLN